MLRPLLTNGALFIRGPFLFYKFYKTFGCFKKGTYFYIRNNKHSIKMANNDYNHTENHRAEKTEIDEVLIWSVKELHNLGRNNVKATKPVVVGHILNICRRYNANIWWIIDECQAELKALEISDYMLLF